jgi:tetratricopeptide (TPR) repeat protein
LQTFSHPVLIWDEAVSRIEGHDDLPGAYRVYHGRGLAYFGIGDLNRAIADYDKAIALNPTYAFAIGDRGFAYYGLGQYERAISEFDHAITLRPDYMRFFAGRGSTLLKMGRRDAGLGEFAYACSKGYACTRYHEELDKANSVKSSGG